MTKISCQRFDEGTVPADAFLPGIPDKRYFKIGEVCAITGVKQHVLRYWESEFRILHPSRAQSKQRLYRRLDVENVLTIKRLLKEEGFTINGAKKVLAKDGGGYEKKGTAPAAKAESSSLSAHTKLMPSGCKQELSIKPADIFDQVKSELLALQKILEG